MEKPDGYRSKAAKRTVKTQIKNRLPAIFYYARNIVHDVSGISTKSTDEIESAKPTLLFLVGMTTFGSLLPPASLRLAAVAFSCKSAFASLGKSAGFFSCSAGPNPPFSKNKKPPFRRFFIFGRDDRIRTCGLCVPNATLYQAEPHPAFHYLIYYNTLFYFFQYFLQLK